MIDARDGTSYITMHAHTHTHTHTHTLTHTHTHKKTQYIQYRALPVEHGNTYIRTSDSALRALNSTVRDGSTFLGEIFQKFKTNIFWSSPGNHPTVIS